MAFVPDDVTQVFSAHLGSVLFNGWGMFIPATRQAPADQSKCCKTSMSTWFHIWVIIIYKAYSCEDQAINQTLLFVSLSLLCRAATGWVGISLLTCQSSRIWWSSLPITAGKWHATGSLTPLGPQALSLSLWNAFQHLTPTHITGTKKRGEESTQNKGIILILSKFLKIETLMSSALCSVIKDC